MVCCARQEKYDCALRHNNIKVVTPEWIIDSVKDKNRKDEELYHPRLTYYEEEEDDASEEENERSSRSDASRRSSPASSRGSSPARRRRSRSPSPKVEVMFDDSDESDKEESNLNWTLAKSRVPSSKDTALINLCDSVPPAPGNAQAPEGTEMIGGWNSTARPLRNITNSGDAQQISRPQNVAHVRNLAYINPEASPVTHHTTITAWS